jgi:hypothetical protein
MTPIELFAWTLSAILGIGFIISLALVARKPKYITEYVSLPSVSIRQKRSEGQ